MADELFAEVKSEGNALDIDKAFERLETKGEAPSESRSEKTEAVAEGDSTPAEAPKESKKWAEMRREIKEAKEAAAAAKAEAEALKQSQQPVTLPKWWVDAHGDTEESKQRYQAVTQKDGELDWLKQNILGELDQRTQAEQQQNQDAEQYVDTQLQELTDEGLKFERNSLLKFMVDFQEEFGAGSLLDAEGNYDFRKGLTLMQKLNPEEPDESTEVKKGLASQAGRSKSPSQSASKIPVVSRRDLRRGWRDAGI